jgi:hypothetical protein
MAKRKKDISEALYGKDGDDDCLTKEEQTKLEQKATTTAFMLMFPALILAGIAVVYAASFYAKALVIALVLYQFLMLNKFIQDYYKRV